METIWTNGFARGIHRHLDPRVAWMVDKMGMCHNDDKCSGMVLGRHDPRGQLITPTWQRSCYFCGLVPRTDPGKNSCLNEDLPIQLRLQHACLKLGDAPS